MNLLPGSRDAAGNIRFSGHVLGYADPGVQEPLSVGIRPENVSVRDQDQPGLKGNVRHRENLGADIFLHVEIDGPGTRIVARTAPPFRPETGIGARVSVAFNPSKLLCFRADGSRLRLPSARLAEIA